MMKMKDDGIRRILKNEIKDYNDYYEMEDATSQVRQELNIDNDTYIDRYEIEKLWKNNKSVEDFKNELIEYLQ